MPDDFDMEAAMRDVHRETAIHLPNYELRALADLASLEAERYHRKTERKNATTSSKLADGRSCQSYRSIARRLREAAKQTQASTIIALGNAAMSHRYDLASALRSLADDVETGITDAQIRDENGNTVGEFHANYPPADAEDAETD